MDENKRQQLIAIEYRINPCCAICLHGKFKPNNDFGQCEFPRNTYQHLKHSGEKHNLSINRLGFCHSFQLDESKKGFFHGFAEFISGEIIN